MIQHTVNIISLDDKVPVIKNYALQHVAKYYTQQGWRIISDPLAIGQAEKTFISTIFSKNRHLAEPYDGMENVEIGGTGWNIHSKLPEEIASIKPPRLNYGFLTRGCSSTRDCSFCVVRQKEGLVHVVAELTDIWNGKEGADITLYDNNILQLPDYFRHTCDIARKYKLRLDFNQGLDFRLFTDDTVSALEGVKLPPRLRIAYDFMDEEEEFVRHLRYIQKVRKEVQVLTLCGYNTTLEEDLRRLDFLWLCGCKPYVMVHENSRGIKEYTQLETYCNSSGGYIHTCSFDDFKNRKYGKSQPIYKLEQHGFTAKKDQDGKNLSWALSEDWLSKNKSSLKEPRFILTDEDKDCILEYFSNDKRVIQLLKVVKRHDDFKPDNLLIGGVSLADAIKIIREKRKIAG